MSTIDLFVDLSSHAEGQDFDLDSREVVNSFYHPVNQIGQAIADFLSTNKVAKVESPPPVADPISDQKIKKAESEEQREEMPPKGNRFIGSYISKRFGGVVCVGQVTGRNANNGLYKIDYGYGWEEITESVLIHHRILFDDLRKIYHRSLCGKVRKYKKKMDIEVKKITGVLKPKKFPSDKKKTSTYIPLIYRETKRDTYYWY